MFIFWMLKAEFKKIYTSLYCLEFCLGGFSVSFETGSFQASQAILELTVTLLPQPPKCCRFLVCFEPGSCVAQAKNGSEQLIPLPLLPKEGAHRRVAYKCSISLMSVCAYWLARTHLVSW